MICLSYFLNFQFELYMDSYNGRWYLALYESHHTCMSSPLRVFLISYIIFISKSLYNAYILVAMESVHHFSQDFYKRL